MTCVSGTTHSSTILGLSVHGMSINAVVALPQCATYPLPRLFINTYIHEVPHSKFHQAEVADDTPHTSVAVNIHVLLPYNNTERTLA